MTDQATQAPKSAVWSSWQQRPIQRLNVADHRPVTPTGRLSRFPNRRITDGGPREAPPKVGANSGATLLPGTALAMKPRAPTVK